MAKSVKIEIYPNIRIKSPVICVIGGPGSGKGTLCARLAIHYNLCHISVGNLLHKEANSGTKMSREIGIKIKMGENVQPELVLKMLEKVMLENTSYDGYLLDGFPRDAQHGLKFEKSIAPITCVLYIKASVPTMRKRLHQRAKTSNRIDDNDLSIEKRIKTFLDKEKEIIKIYVSKLRKISGEQSIKDVFASSVNVLSDYLLPKSQ